MVTRFDFDGIQAYELRSDALAVTVMEYGATLTGITFAGKKVGLGYDTMEEYRKGTAYLGAAIGRFANRIGKGRFTLNGRDYQVSVNENGNTLHGGAASYDVRLWHSEVIGDDAVKFTLHSPDGDNGFPGNLTAAVTYRVEGDTLTLTFEGDCDADTFYNPTSHMYFNLDAPKSVLETKVSINACGTLEVDGELIPTGTVLPLTADTDFTAPKKPAHYFDHCFVCGGDGVKATAEGGGVKMTLTADYPALQYYTGEFIGAPFGAGGGFAMEPQFYPDGMNHEGFASGLLKAGEHFRKTATYHFEKA